MLEPVDLLLELLGISPTKGAASFSTLPASQENDRYLLTRQARCANT